MNLRKVKDLNSRLCFRFSSTSRDSRRIKKRNKQNIPREKVNNVNNIGRRSNEISKFCEIPIKIIVEFHEKKYDNSSYSDITNYYTEKSKAKLICLSISPNFDWLDENKNKLIIFTNFSGFGEPLILSSATW